MGYQTDAGGFAFACNDMKLFSSASTWATKLSQLYKQPGIVRIVTYSLPNVAYVWTQFERRPRDIFLLANTRFLARAQDIKRMFPALRVAVHEEAHSKVLLIEPYTVYLSSANFGKSGWHESSIGLHSREAHDWYREQMFEPLWEASQEIPGQGAQAVS